MDIIKEFCQRVLDTPDKIAIVENNNKINISTQINNGKSTVHLSTKPITIVNGKRISESQKNRNKAKKSWV